MESIITIKGLDLLKFIYRFSNEWFHYYYYKGMKVSMRKELENSLNDVSLVMIAQDDNNSPYWSVVGLIHSKDEHLYDFNKKPLYPQIQSLLIYSHDGKGNPLR